MPTQDYSDAANSYNLKFSGQSRSAATPASVSSNHQWDRDNLLHFIEDNFKSGIRNSVSVEDLRAFFHILVKSVRNQVDDSSYGILAASTMRISTGAANRYYYGSQTYGWAYHIWSQYTTSDLDNTTLPSISGLHSITGVVAPFDLYNFGCRLTLMNDTSTGDVDIKFYYGDSDENASANIQNMTYIGQVPTKSLAVTDTGYDAVMTSTVKVPAGKRVYMFVRNTGWTSGTEYLRISWTMFYETHSANWTV